MCFYLPLDRLTTGSAQLIGIHTPGGYSVHKNYLIQISKLNYMEFCYINRFPIPIGTKVSIILTDSNQELRLYSLVTSNSKSENGRYTVGCNNLSLYWTRKNTPQGCPSAFTRTVRELAEYLN